MMYLCIVIEVNQKRMQQRTIVMIPGTHPKTLIVQRYQMPCGRRLTRETRTEP